uniref:Uncharacterized protein n=1 Tax=Auxenochlorella protothecoides TaxID=3075 RepID=A0A1D1ZQY5_AUXPR
MQGTRWAVGNPHACRPALAATPRSWHRERVCCHAERPLQEGLQALHREMSLLQAASGRHGLTTHSSNLLPIDPLPATRLLLREAQSHFQSHNSSSGIPPGPDTLALCTFWCYAALCLRNVAALAARSPEADELAAACCTLLRRRCADRAQAPDAAGLKEAAETLDALAAYLGGRSRAGWGRVLAAELAPALDAVAGLACRQARERALDPSHAAVIVAALARLRHDSVAVPPLLAAAGRALVRVGDGPRPSVRSVLLVLRGHLAMGYAPSRILLYALQPMVSDALVAREGAGRGGDGEMETEEEGGGEETDEEARSAAALVELLAELDILVGRQGRGLAAQLRMTTRGAAGEVE